MYYLLRLYFFCGLLLSFQWSAYAKEVDIEQVLSGFDNAALIVKANSADDMDAVLEGFADEESGIEGSTEDDKVSDTLNGSLNLSATYNFAHDAPELGQADYRGLSRLRAKLSLESKHRFANDWWILANGYIYYDLAYAINGRNNYLDAVRDAYQSEAELGELYIQGRTSESLDFKFGRQIVIWGKSDSVRVTDVLNPLDQRELGLVDIKDLRLPLTMAKLDYYCNNWNLSIMVIPEIRSHKNPPYGSDFYPFPITIANVDKPSHGGRNSEVAIAANGVFSGWDISFYLARLYDDNAYVVASSSGPRQKYARIRMMGTAFDIALGNWLVKGEIAHLRGLRYSGLHGVKPDRSDTMFGVEYTGFDNTTLSAEVVDRYTHGHLKTFTKQGINQNEWQVALRYQSDLLYDRVHLIAVTTHLGRHLQSGFTRLSAGYDLTDAFTFTTGLVLYHPGDTIPFTAIGDNDRAFVDLVYSF